MKRAPFLMITLIVLATSDATRAAAPQGRYSLTTDTVYDNKTGLTWQRNVLSGFSDTYSQSGAADYCNWLGKQQKLGGYTDWRLPSKKELETLLDVRAVSPSIDAAFPNTPSENFWTSSAFAGGANAAWLMNFDDGSTGTGATSNLNRVRCVR